MGAYLLILEISRMVRAGKDQRKGLSRVCWGVVLLWIALTQVSAQEVLYLPIPVSKEQTAKTLPISLDTVLRLAQDQNGQMAIARQRLQEAFSKQDLATKHWLPELTVGPSYYRHEGGIQDFTGHLINSSYGSVFGGMEVRGKLDVREVAFQRVDAERKVWQQKGELSKLTNETLLDAGGTYIDLLAARTSEIVSLESENKLAELAGLAQKLARIDPGLNVEVVRIRSELQGQKFMTRKLREGANNAAAKLLYLLGLDPSFELAPIDHQLAAFEIVDAHSPLQVLVAQALSKGPGVRELEGLLTVIEEARSKGSGRFIPTLEVTMAEGAFGAGPGSNLAWDNRWDLGMHLKWNLTEALNGRERRRIADAQNQQARLSYQDLRAKLTLGVQEAREAIFSAKDQMHLGELQIRDAEETLQLSNSRLKENIKGRSPSEVLMSIRTVAGARFNYLQAIRDFDKAQLRLFVLTAHGTP